jgi:cysteine desulfurase
MQHPNKQIYLDNQSTTMVDERVQSAMMPYFSQLFGNPASDNSFGLSARTAVTRARQNIADLINAAPQEIYFTSGATEAINWAIRGIAEKAPLGKNHIITTAIEHSAVLKTCEFLEKHCHFRVTKIKPSQDGIIDSAKVLSALTPQTLLVIIQHANNEIGTIQPLKKIGRLCDEMGITFLVDAAQSIGKIDCDVAELKIDLLAASGHKIYAPKGIGFLYIRDAIKKKITPLLYGGGQEGTLRSGTQNVPYIVALGEACKICNQEMQDESERVLALRNEFLNILITKIPDMIINGSLSERLPGNINFSVPGISSDLLLRNIKGIIVSKGAACNSEKKQQSHILLSISDDDALINSAVRIGIGRFNTLEEISYAANKIVGAIKAIKKASAEF